MMSAKEQSVIREFDLAGLNEECQKYFLELGSNPPREIWADNIANYISKVKRPLEGQIGRYTGRNGEAFNAATSFFKPKMSYTMKKWRKKEQHLHYIFCNADGYPDGYKPRNVSVWSDDQEKSAPNDTLLIKIDLLKRMYKGDEIQIPQFGDMSHSA